MLRLGALTAALALFLAAPVAAQVPAVEIVAPDNLALTYDSGETSTGSVWVRNGTDAAFAPRFRTSVQEADGTAEPLNVIVVDDAGEEVRQAHDVRAHDVTRYRLFLRPPPKSQLADASGELVVSGGDDVDSLSLSVAKKAFADRGVTGALLVPVVPALVLVLWGGISAVAGKKIDLSDSLTSDLDYSKSFASTLTAAGALLGTVIAASVLPQETTTLSKAAFVALNLVFGVGVVVAGLVYAAFQRGVWTDVKPEEHGKEPTRQQRKMEGTVAGFLSASLITVWAVFGELLTIWLLLDELGQDQGFSGTALGIFKALIVAAAVTMCVYTVRRIPAIVDSERAKSGPGTNRLGPEQVPSRTAAPAQSIPLL